MKNRKFKVENVLKLVFSLCLCVSVVNISLAQEMPPEPSSPRAVTIPKIFESNLPNGLKIVVVERKNVPLVSVNLLINAGASSDSRDLSGVTNMTASLLNKGTKTRTAEAISEQMEFLGSSVEARANWLTSNVGFSATTDKLNNAMAIFADVILNPTFPQKEIDLYKSQLIDDLTANLKQPGTLAAYVAAQYTFREHSVPGTPETIKAITRKDLLNIYKENYTPDESTLIFVGDITQTQANIFATKYFGLWNTQYDEQYDAPAVGEKPLEVSEYRNQAINKPVFSRILVIDLPNAGQAAVVYGKEIQANISGRKYGVAATRDNENYYSASVANSLLGGGYSSRMNQEIRIKRGLSYGAGSSIAWRWNGGNFQTRVQTKNESAAEVAELTLAEINRLINENATDEELTPRKNVINGNFGRSFETNVGISNQISEFIMFGIKTDELNSYMEKTSDVKAEQVKDFSLFNLKGGDIIIVGDYAKFKDDLAKRFPNQKVEVIKESELNLNSNNLRK